MVVENENVKQSVEKGSINQGFKTDPEDLKVVGNGVVKNDELEKELDEDVDPWELVTEVKAHKPWSQLDVKGKVLRVLTYIGLTILALFLLLMFICSIDLLGNSFQLMAGRTAGAVFNNNELLNNPVVCLMIGVAVTVMLQSSSTSTSIVVTMVGARIIPVQNAIYIIMGANVGTTVTAFIVSLGQIADKTEFRRAFAAANCHDMFNWMTVLIVLPLEVITGYLNSLTKLIVDTIDVEQDIDEPQFLKVITEPITKSIIVVDKDVVYSTADYSIQKKRPLAEYLCDEEKYTECFDFPTDADIDNEPLWEYIYETKEFPYYWSSDNETAYDVIRNDTICNATDVDLGDLVTRVTISITNFTSENTNACDHWFTGTGLPSKNVVSSTPDYKYLNLSDAGAGAIIFFFALTMMVVCLVGLVKILSYILNGPLLKIVRKVINYEGTYYDSTGQLKTSLILRELIGYACILIGCGLTILVQSSSVFTSTINPLVGMGIISVDRTYPLVLGSNIGTTVTSVIAGFTSPPETIRDSLQVAFAHLFFNISGILIFYPIVYMRHVPIKIAKFMGNTVADYRWFAIVYLLAMFLIFPAIVFGLSLAGWQVLLGVAIPIVMVILAVAVINVMQNHCRKALPQFLQSWDFLPPFLRSLEPYDKVFTKCCVCCKLCQSEEPDHSKVAPMEMNLTEDRYSSHDENEKCGKSEKDDKSTGNMNEADSKVDEPDMQS